LVGYVRRCELHGFVTKNIFLCWFTFVFFVNNFFVRIRNGGNTGKHTTAVMKNIYSKENIKLGREPSSPLSFSSASPHSKKSKNLEIDYLGELDIK